MAMIFIRVSNRAKALETMLYVFKNQMNLGTKSLIFTMKHRDGYREYCRGSVDDIFKNEMMVDIEQGDLLLLEHYGDSSNRFIFFNEDVSIESLSNIAKKTSSCCQFILPRGNTFAYFMIKEWPMMSYILEGNDIISDSLLGNAAAILNNICGKLDFSRGIYATLRIV